MNNDLNKNYHVHHGEQYNGLRIMGNVYPMISECLEALHDVVSKSLTDYSRAFAFRFDLRFPDHMQADPAESCNSVASRFIDSFKAKIRHNRQSLAKNGVLYHDTKVRFLWVREVGDCARVHYHFVVLLNGHAFNCLGSYLATEGNISSRICEAWASALGESVERAKPLVHFPNSPAYCLRRSDPESVSEFFYRASYLCKVQTKKYGHGHHCYGASRK
jgi:hypothetical protein